jgi:hypothetical protein
LPSLGDPLAVLEEEGGAHAGGIDHRRDNDRARRGDRLPDRQPRAEHRPGTPKEQRSEDLEELRPQPRVLWPVPRELDGPRADQIAHGEPVAFSDFVVEFGQSTLENWQSEFLQLFSFVVLSALLIHRGSGESKDSADRMEQKIDGIAKRLDELAGGNVPGTSGR